MGSRHNKTREKQEREEREVRERKERERKERERKERERKKELERIRREEERIKKENERRRKEMERKRREKERKEREKRERERQIKIEEEITSYIESNIKNLRKEIDSFKSNFENNYFKEKKGYIKYFKELQDLLEKVEKRKINPNIYNFYPYEYKKNLHKKVINYEIKNFQKFLYEEIYQIIDNLAKNRKFSECLESIEELENNFSLNEIDFLNYQKEDYLKNLKTIKSHCELMLKCNKSKEIFNQGNYDESIKLLKELYLNSTTDMERELYSKNIRNMKIEYINNITKKNINLLHSNNNYDIIKESEKIFNKFDNGMDLLELSISLHELKVVYCKALQNIILEKKKIGQDFCEEYSKYNTIILTEKFPNEFKDFIIII